MQDSISAPPMLSSLTFLFVDHPYSLCLDTTHGDRFDKDSRAFNSVQDFLYEVNGFSLATEHPKSCFAYIGDPLLYIGLI
jgi:hypothetical protein